MKREGAFRNGSAKHPHVLRFTFHGLRFTACKPSKDFRRLDLEHFAVESSTPSSSDPGSRIDSRMGVKEIGNSRFLCENAVFQRTTPHHVILNGAQRSEGSV